MEEQETGPSNAGTSENGARGSPINGIEVRQSSRAATDIELTRVGTTSRRYLAHVKKLSKKVQIASRYAQYTNC